MHHTFKVRSNKSHPWPKCTKKTYLLCTTLSLTHPTNSIFRPTKDSWEACICMASTWINLTCWWAPRAIIRTNRIVNRVMFRQMMREVVSFIRAFCKRIRGRSTSMRRTRETLKFLSWAVIIPIMISSLRTLLLKSNPFKAKLSMLKEKDWSHRILLLSRLVDQMINIINRTGFSPTQLSRLNWTN